MNAEKRIDALFDLAPDEFTAARDQVVRELREEGDRDAATRVRGLKKPSLAAWAANSLARRHRAEVEKLVRAGERLREAQRSVLEGGEATTLREAVAARRKLTDRLVDRATEMLGEGGHAASRTHLDGVERTLQAATLSEDAARELLEGRLERELEPPEGLEAVGVWEVAPPTPLEPRSERKARKEAEARKAREEAEAAEEEAKRLAAEADRAEREAGEARRAAKRAAAKAERARRRADELGQRASGR
jgi:hypothetical protein